MNAGFVFYVHINPTRKKKSMTGKKPDTELIVSKAREFGASLAGVALVNDLKGSSSYAEYHRAPYYDGYTGAVWPEHARSVLVLAIHTDAAHPELDWWSDDIPGRTPGNRILMKTSRKIKKWLQEKSNIKAAPLPYHIENGGVFLKDSAVLAGMGVIGKNNLLVTPEFGPRVRLRALFLDVELESAGPVDFAPCSGCDAPCLEMCPQNAFKRGSYDVKRCHREMERNRRTLIPVDGKAVGTDNTCRVVKFCRECELSCPAGRSARQARSDPCS